MPEEIKVGDVVELKSGSPEMTVTQVKEGTAYVTWFTEDEEVKSGAFDLSSLNLVEEDKLPGIG